MIIAKTPYRISFFGGGTDFPEWFKENNGAVISTTIDKYCYLSVRELPPFFDHKYRLVYSDIELVKKFDDIKHPSVRECLRFLNITEGVEIHYDGDLPSRSGLGSSSAFTISLLNALKALRGHMMPKRALADLAILIDRDVVGEVGGLQDQIACTYGGLNHISFHANDYSVRPLIVAPRIKRELESGLCLFFTGKSRIAEHIEREKIDAINDKKSYYQTLLSLTEEANKILMSKNFLLKDFGSLLLENWKAKKQLSRSVSNPDLESIFDTAHQIGAYGGKCLGAGGGGFVLFCVEPYLRTKLIEALYPMIHVPFKFSYEGSHIALYQPD